MAKWDLVRLQEIASADRSAISKPYGSAMVKEDYRSSGVPVVRGVNLSRGRFYDDDFVFIEPELANRMPGAEMVAGDLVLTHRGTIGQVSMIPREPRYPKYVASTSHVKVRLDSEQAIPEFYYYWFASEVGRSTILENSSTVGVPGLAQPVATIKNLRVPKPSLDEQRRIVSLLVAIDDKISSDRAVAKAADRLRSIDVSAALGDVEAPSPLSSLARFVNGRAFTKDASSSGRVVVRIAELNSGVGPSTVYNDIDVPDDHLVRPGDLLFAWSGSLTVSRWYREEAIVNQHIFKVLPKDGRPLWLVDHALRAKLAEFRAVAADKATTMGHIQRRHLDELVSVPSAEDTRRLDSAMTSLWNRALAAEVESVKLERTRDELLPLLMSGKARVKDAEKVVGEVL